MKICPNTQKSLDWCEGMPQYPGIRRRVYFCKKSLIVRWPKLPKDNFGRVTSSLLKGEFVLAEGAFWQPLDVNADKSTTSSETQGAAPGQLQLNKATFVHNSIDEAATTAAALLLNNDIVYIYEDMQGCFRILGNRRWPTVTTVRQEQGAGNTPASTTIAVEVTDTIAPPFFNGPVATEDGDVFPHNFVTDPDAGLVISNEYVTLREGGDFYSEEDEYFLDVIDQDGNSNIEIEEDYITINIE